MLRFACSLRNGSVVIALGRSKSQCGQSEANNSCVSALIASNVASVSLRFERSSGWLVKYISRDVLARPAPQQRRFRRAHHVFGIQPLHQERRPGEPALDPDHLQLRKALGDAVDDPVGEMHQIEVHERERVHGNESIALLHRLIAPVEAGMKAERLAGRLDRGIERHIAVVMHRPEPGRGDRKADDARDCRHIARRL